MIWILTACRFCLYCITVPICLICEDMHIKTLTTNFLLVQAYWGWYILLLIISTWNLLASYLSGTSEEIHCQFHSFCFVCLLQSGTNVIAPNSNEFENCIDMGQFLVRLWLRQNLTAVRIFDSSFHRSHNQHLSLQGLEILVSQKKFTPQLWPCTLVYRKNMPLVNLPILSCICTAKQLWKKVIMPGQSLWYVWYMYM